VLLPGTRWRIVDEDGRPVPHDGTTPGELHYRGAFVASGYFQNPDATRAAITADGWLRSGDVCTIDKLGYVRIVDRAKDLVKSAANGFHLSIWKTPSWVIPAWLKLRL